MKKLILLGALLSWSSMGRSSIVEVNHEKLLSSMDRPTMVDVVLSLQNQCSSDSRTSAQSYAHALESNNMSWSLGIVAGFTSEGMRQVLPQIIAQSELAYPGLRYVMMGRDTAFLADAIEAYYVSIGQMDRVIRLPGGRHTVNNDEQELYGLLQESGFSPKADGSGRPFILMDRTIYNRPAGGQTTAEYSQMKRLLSAGFRAGKQLGISPEQMKTQFGGIALTDSMSIDITPASRRQYFKKWKLQTETAYSFVKQKEAIALESPAEIFQVRAEYFIHKSRFGGDREAWHESYGPMTYDDYGQARASHGEVSKVEIREKILTEMKGLWSFESTDDFHQLVQKSMADLGIQSSIESSPNLFNRLETTTAESSVDEKIRGLEILENLKSIDDFYAATLIANWVRRSGLTIPLRRVSAGHLRLKMAAALLRIDLLETMKASGVDRNDAQYEKTLKQTLAGLTQLGVWQMRSAEFASTLDASISDIQAALNAADSPTQQAVSADLFAAWEESAPKMDQELRLESGSHSSLGLAIWGATKEFSQRIWQEKPLRALGAVGGVAGVLGAVHPTILPIEGFVMIPFLINWGKIAIFRISEHFDVRVAYPVSDRKELAKVKTNQIALDRTAARILNVDKIKTIGSCVRGLGGKAP